MFWRPAAALLIGILAGVACIASLPFIRSRQSDLFARTESYYRYPITVRDWAVKLRRDSFGKGYFGASRNGGRTHQVVDLSLDVHMPVFAAKSGRVVVAGVGKGYGKYVEIRHPDGRSSRYAHLSELCCVRGDWVERGRVIGVSGKTGNAADRRIRPHLHFEILLNGKPMNPAVLLDPAVKMG